MGVPAFFRWLSRKYPSIVVHCIEEKPQIINNVSIPVDTSKENPNRIEFDNLYLDMNGIIHPCCHPENKPAPKNEDEMMVEIFAYIDRIFSIVRPRRLLYMAIDGVAPRAKMNQQRSRRFRAAKESVEKAEEIARIRQELEIKGAKLPPEKPKEEHFDSNCITPGTPFMDRLAKCLHYYIHDRLNNDPGWKNINVILSDASVPGEGEHKIMDFIRRQRSNPDHDPNTHHCLCGADADLIMLGLATHEPNFTIIREEFKPNQPKPCDICGQLGHEMKECVGLPKEKIGEFDELEKPIASETEFIFIRLSILREYLSRDLRMPNLPFEYNFERAVDDWVFMCFFVGNDFLPHLPSLEIREGAIDRLVLLYKDTVYRTGGFLTNSGNVNLSRVQLIMTNLGEVEDEIFKKRQQTEEMFRARRKQENKRKKLMNDRPAWTPQGQFAPNPLNKSPLPIQNARKEAYNMRMQGMQHNKYSTYCQESNSANKDAANALREMLKSDGSDDSKKSDENSSASKGEKRKKTDDDDSDEEEIPYDAVRLWEPGWKDRYYAQKFDVSPSNIKFRQDVATSYVKGLCWVLKYYYQGCPSWTWFFPYHYAPFASDFVNIGDEKIVFEKNTKPFKPLEQLMGVFPAASKQHLPKPWAELMIDPDSAIIDFYPDDFKIDLNGKKFAWQGVALLPFVDEQRLLRSLEEVYPLLTEEERKRNTRGDDILYAGKDHTGYNYMLGFYEINDYETEYDLSPQLFNGIQGKILLSDKAVGSGDIVHSPINGVEDIPDNRVISMRFRDPKYDDDYIFPSVLLPNAKIPSPVLKPEDFEKNREWRPQIGMAPSNQRASLGMSGRRTLNWHMSSGGTQYNAVPPTYDSPRSQGRNLSKGTQYNAVAPTYDSPRSQGRNSYWGMQYNTVAPTYDSSRSQERNHYMNNSRSHAYYGEDETSYTSGYSQPSRYSNQSRNSWAYRTENSRGSTQWSDPYQQPYASHYPPQSSWDSRNQQYHDDHRQSHPDSTGTRYPNAHSTYYRR